MIKFLYIQHVLVKIRTAEFVPGSRDKNICVYRDNISGVELLLDNNELRVNATVHVLSV